MQTSSGGGVLASIALLAVLAGGCAEAATPSRKGAVVADTQAAAGSTSLAGTEWVVVRLRGTPALPRPRSTLEFEDSTFGGYGACNWYGGDYTSGRDTLRFGMIGMTARACAADAMRQEAGLDSALRATRRQRHSADTLRLLDDAGRPIAELARRRLAAMDPAQLVGTRWRLTSLDGRPPLAGTRITLALSRDSIMGNAGCRDYTGSYHARGHRFGRTSMAMVQMECPSEPLRREEGEFLTVISESHDYQIRGDTLYLLALSGQSLRFVRDQ